MDILFSAFYCSCMLCLISKLSFAHMSENNGIIKLDSTTFDKIISKFNAVLVKFDEAFKYEKEQIQFQIVGEMSIQERELIVAEVDFREKTSKDNSELKERYNLSMKYFPEYWLFLNGGNRTKIYRGRENDALEIAKFITDNTGFWIGLPGSLKEFDELLKQYFSSPKKREDIVRQAESACSKITDKKVKEKADNYMKILRKVNEDGPKFVTDEMDRLRKIFSGNKVGTKKRLELDIRYNVLTVFKSIMTAKKFADDKARGSNSEQ